MLYSIHSDGACINNGLENAIASWSFMVTDENNTVVQASTGMVAGEQNNNRAELTAFINVLGYICSHKGNYIVYVDYEAIQLYINGVSNPKSNKDLYREIARLHMRCSNRVIVQKVKAHSSLRSVGNFINGVVDKLAKKSIEFFGQEEGLKRAS